MADYYGWTVRFLHIFSGILWIGGALLWSAIIMPRVTQQVPPPARGPFVVNVGPIVATYLTNAGYATILTGVWLLATVRGGFGEIVSGLQSGAWGTAIGIGLVLSLVAIGIAHAVIKPSLKEMIEILKKMPAGPPPAGAAPPAPPARIAELGKKLMISSMITMALAVIIVIAMAFAVNFRAG